jgi:ABC-type multidrug transport system fused ATPase/permease subunit
VLGPLRDRLSRWAIDDGADVSVPVVTGGRGGRLRRLWLRMQPYVGSNRRLVVLLVIASGIGGLSEATLIYLVVRIAAALSEAKSVFAVNVGPLSNDLSVGQCFAFAVAALGVTALADLSSVVLTARLSTASLNRARKRTMAAYLDAGWPQQSSERAGRLQELLSTHVGKISQAVLAISTSINAMLSFSALMLSAIVIKPLAAVLILTAVVGVGALLLPLSRRTKIHAARQVKDNTNYAVHVAQTVNVAREVNVFGVGDVVRDEMERQADEVARSGFTTRLLLRGNPTLYQLAVMAALLAGLAAVRGSPSTDFAELGSVVVLLVRALSYSQQINGALQQAHEITPYIEDVERQEAKYRADPPRFGTTAVGTVDAIEVRDLTFGYDPAEPVLHDVSFTVRRGEVIGIVGPSGGGKSTLMHILLRLRVAQRGTYAVNGTPVSEFDRASWTRAVSLVPQDNHLIRATAAENIAFHRPLARDAIEHAAVVARLDAELRALPLGYDTQIGPGAMDLSGGQRQRLGLARALAADPQILILDEPTSALDMRSEVLIQESLGDLRGTLTMFIVAHRITTLSVCDRILVIQEGRITASGPFAELVESSAFFRDAVQLSRLD